MLAKWIVGGVIGIFATILLFFAIAWIRQSPFFFPYRQEILALTSVPEYQSSQEKILTDFDGRPTLIIGCDWSDSFCVQAIPLFDEIVQSYSGLTVRILALSDRYFSTTIPQIQSSAMQTPLFDDVCNAMPRYYLRSSTGLVMYNSCTDERSLANVLENSIF